MKPYNTIIQLFKDKLFLEWLCKNSCKNEFVYNFYTDEIFIVCGSNAEYITDKNYDPIWYKKILYENFIDLPYRYIEIVALIEMLLNQVKDKLNETIECNYIVVLKSNHIYLIDKNKCPRYLYYKNYELNRPLCPQVQALIDCLHRIYEVENK